MKEVTITYSMDVTEVVKDPAEIKFLMDNKPEDLRAVTEQNWKSQINLDGLKIRNFKVFPHEEVAE